jgi:hypothetical protein
MEPWWNGTDKGIQQYRPSWTYINFKKLDFSYVE